MCDQGWLEDLTGTAEMAIEHIHALADLMGRADESGETPEYVASVSVMICEKLEPIKQFFDYHARDRCACDQTDA